MFCPTGKKKEMNHPHDYIEKCPHCGRFMTFQQAQHHSCDNIIADVKQIDITYYFETVDALGNRMIIARGLDGVLYRLRKLSDGFLQRKKPAKDFTVPVFHRLQTDC